MPVETLTEIPCSFEAGTTLRFTRSWSEFPATTWTAALKLQKDGAAPSSYAATADGATHVWHLTATQTDALAPGVYQYAIYVTSSADVARAESGIVTVTGFLGEAQTAGFVQTALTAVRTAIENLVSKKFSSVSLNGQSHTLQSIGELYSIERNLAARLVAEQEKAAALRGQGSSRNIQVVFVS